MSKLDCYLHIVVAAIQFFSFLYAPPNAHLISFLVLLFRYSLRSLLFMCVFASFACIDYFPFEPRVYQKQPLYPTKVEAKSAYILHSPDPTLWDYTGVASAPGKVLMTGGYLVLERPNAGIVLSTNARFYAIVKPLYEEIKPESWT